MSNLPRSQIIAGCMCIALAVAWTLSEKKNARNHSSQGTDEVISDSGDTDCNAPPLPIDPEEKNALVISSGLGKAHPAMLLAVNEGCVYLDYNATTPIFPEVSTAILPFITMCFGNPSSPHIYAKPCRETIISARHSVGLLVNAPYPLKSIIFTSCGSESDNRAIDIAVHHYHTAKERVGDTVRTDKHISPPPRVITSSVEHPAILAYLNHLQSTGVIAVDVAGVTAEGVVSLEDISNFLSPHTALVTIMHSNNEVGTIQPIREISSKIKQFNALHNTDILVHSDGAQSLGKVTVDVQSLGLDMLTIVGHKYGAPKGVAALYLKDGIRRIPMLFGGGQEGGLRAGTENVALIAGLGAASRLARDEADLLFMHMLTLKLRLMVRLKSKPIGQIADLLKFNGPARSSDIAALKCDLSVMNMMLRSTKTLNIKNINAIDSDARNDNTNMNDGNDNDDGNVDSSIMDSGTGKDKNEANSNSSSGSSNAHKEEVKEGGGFTLSSKCLVDQLPNTLSVSFKGIMGHQLMPLILDKVACSAGSACHSDSHHMSPVLTAMRVPSEYGFGTLRLSWGRHTTEGEIDRAVDAIAEAVRSLL